MLTQSSPRRLLLPTHRSLRSIDDPAMCSQKQWQMRKPTSLAVTLSIASVPLQSTMPQCTKRSTGMQGPQRVLPCVATIAKPEDTPVCECCSAQMRVNRKGMQDSLACRRHDAALNVPWQPQRIAKRRSGSQEVTCAVRSFGPSLAMLNLDCQRSCPLVYFKIGHTSNHSRFCD